MVEGEAARIIKRFRAKVAAGETTSLRQEAEAEIAARDSPTRSGGGGGGGGTTSTTTQSISTASRPEPTGQTELKTKEVAISGREKAPQEDRFRSGLFQEQIRAAPFSPTSITGKAITAPPTLVQATETRTIPIIGGQPIIDGIVEPRPSKVRIGGREFEKEGIGSAFARGDLLLSRGTITIPGKQIDIGKGTADLIKAPPRTSKEETFIQGVGRGAIQEVRTRPLRLLTSATLGVAAGGVTGLAGKSAVGLVATKTIGGVATGAFIGTVTAKTILAETPGQKGRVIGQAGTEVIAFGVGGKIGKSITTSKVPLPKTQTTKKTIDIVGTQKQIAVVKKVAAIPSKGAAKVSALKSKITQPVKTRVVAAKLKVNRVVRAAKISKELVTYKIATSSSNLLKAGVKKISTPIRFVKVGATKVTAPIRFVKAKAILAKANIGRATRAAKVSKELLFNKVRVDTAKILAAGSKKLSIGIRKVTTPIRFVKTKAQVAKIAVKRGIGKAEIKVLEGKAFLKQSKINISKKITDLKVKALQPGKNLIQSIKFNVTKAKITARDTKTILKAGVGVIGSKIRTKLIPLETRINKIKAFTTGTIKGAKLNIQKAKITAKDTKTILKAGVGVLGSKIRTGTLKLGIKATAPIKRGFTRATAPIRKAKILAKREITFRAENILNKISPNIKIVKVTPSIRIKRLQFFEKTVRKVPRLEAEPVKAFVVPKTNLLKLGLAKGKPIVKATEGPKDIFKALFRQQVAKEVIKKGSFKVPGATIIVKKPQAFLKKKIGNKILLQELKPQFTSIKTKVTITKPPKLDLPKPKIKSIVGILDKQSRFRAFGVTSIKVPGQRAGAKSSQGLKEETGQKADQKADQKTDQKPAQSIINLPKQITETGQGITTIPVITPELTTRTTTEIIKIPKLKVPTKIKLPDFDKPQPRFTSGFTTKRKKISRETRFLPSLEAVLPKKKIFGKQPKLLTGFELRPVLKGVI